MGFLSSLFGNKPVETNTETHAAEALLLAYGYTTAGDGFYEPARPSSERWRKVAGGWECYASAGASMGGGAPWGRVLMLETVAQDADGNPLQVATGFMQVPFTQSENYKNVSGLHPAANPEAFEWVWPDARLVEIYSHLAEPGGNKWVKVGDTYSQPAHTNNSSMGMGV